MSYEIKTSEKTLCQSAWQKCFRSGFCPQLTDAQLIDLAEALERDDPRIIQGATTQPPPLACVADFPVECACPIGFAAMMQGASTVGEVEEQFANLCFGADNLLGERAACRYFLSWADETPREEMLSRLSAECRVELAARPNRIGIAQQAPETALETITEF